MAQIKDREFDQPLTVPPKDVLAGKRPYLLFPEAFLKMTKVPDTLGMWASTFLGAFLTLLITIGAKLLANKFDQGGYDISKWEYWAASIVLIVYAVLKMIAYGRPSERAKTIKQIEKHFDKQPDPAQLWTEIVTDNDKD